MTSPALTRLRVDDEAGCDDSDVRDFVEGLIAEVVDRVCESPAGTSHVGGKGSDDNSATSVDETDGTDEETDFAEIPTSAKQQSNETVGVFAKMSSLSLVTEVDEERIEVKDLQLDGAAGQESISVKGKGKLVESELTVEQSLEKLGVAEELDACNEVDYASNSQGRSTSLMEISHGLDISAMHHHQEAAYVFVSRLPSTPYKVRASMVIVGFHVG